MTDKVYIVPSDMSAVVEFGLVESRHLGIVVVKDGKTYFIDGMQSAGFGISFPGVAVDTAHNPVFGNVIVTVSQFDGELTQGEIDSLLGNNSVDLNLSSGDATTKGQAILDAIATISEGESYSLTGDEGRANLDGRQFYDFDVGYFAATLNSNSVANTLLNAAGINLRDVVVSPGGTEVDDYLGRNAILDTAGSQAQHIYEANSVYIDRGGSDTIIVESGASVRITNDADGGSSNTVVINDIDPADIRAVRVGTDLELWDMSGVSPRLIVSLVGHFGANGPSTSQVQIDYQNNITTIGVTDLDSGDLGRLFSANATWYSDTRAFYSAEVFTSWDPLMIDLDGDGIETVARFNGTHFDLDGNGFAEDTGWVHADDGFLVYDENEDGEISGSELFGNATTDGFTELSTHDSNSDGKINSSDTIFSDLQVWNDVNRDGYAQSDELFSMADLDIESISLNASVVNTSTTGGTITHTGTLTYENQTTTTIANVAFTRDTSNTRYIEDFTLDLDTLGLPDLRGYNAMADLRTAMSLDNSGTGNLKDIVVGIASSSVTDIFENFPTIQSDITDALYRWAGVDDVSPTSRGAYVDAQKLAFIEAYFGEAFVDANFPSPNPGIVQATQIHDLFDDLLTRFIGNILIQTVAGVLYDETPVYNSVTDAIIGDTDLSADTLAMLEDYATNDLTTTAARQQFWLGVASFLQGVHLSIANGDGFGLSSGDVTALNTAIENSDSDLTWASEDHSPVGGITSIEYRIFSPIGDTITGTSSNNNISGTANDDVLVGLGGADEILASAGDDILYGHNADGSGDDNAADFLSGSTGNDTLYGGGGNDTLRGDDNSDHLIGGSGDDILMESYAGGSGQNLLEDADGDDDFRISAASSRAADIFVQDTEGVDRLRFTSSTKSVATILTSDETKFTLSDLTFTRYLNNSLSIVGSNGSVGFNVVLVDQLTDLSNTTGVGIEYLMLYATHSSSSSRATLDLKSYLSSWSGPMATVGSEMDDVIFGITFGSEDDDIESKGGNDTVYGDAGDDDIDGGSGNDILYGGEGADDILGNSNDDILYGDAGNDTLNGGTNNDVLYGGAGDDTLIGGAGNNTMEGGTDNDSLTASSGNDIFIYSAGNDTFQDGGGTDNVYLPVNVIPEELAFSNTGTVNVTVDIAGSMSGQIVFVGQRSGSSSLYIEFINYGDGFVQYFDNYTGWKIDTNTGSGSDETINGGNGITYETFIGRGGTDRIYGGNDYDSISGGADNDFLYGDAGADHLHGGSGNDELYGGTGTDNLWGGTGSDLLAGGAGIDLLNGETGTDTATYSAAAAGVTVNLALGTASNDGDSGSDTLVNIENLRGSAYNDSLTGDGNDNLIRGGAGNDALDGGSGTDTADYSAAAADVTVNLGSGTASNDGDGGSDTLVNFENVAGSTFNDVISGDASANTLSGDSGNDSLYGAAGADTLDGGSGTDTADYSAAAAGVTVDLSTGTTADDGDGSSDTLFSIENVTGSGYVDVLTGSSGANGLSGGAGNDIVAGGAGNDTIDGGADTDTVDYSVAAAGVTINLASGTASNDGDGGSDTISNVENITGSGYNDTISGNSGNNTLVGGSGADTVDYNAAASGVTVNLATGTATGDGTDTLSGFENVTGSGYADTITGDSAANALNGGNGNDVIAGQGGVDAIDGGGGSDTVSYGAAASSVTVNLSSGTASNDGDSGSDTLTSIENVIGSANNDSITGDGSANLIEGGAGNDSMDGGGGTDTLSYASAGSAITINLATGTGQATGGAGTDTVTGFENLTGSAYNDTLTGDSNANVIIGGDGNDTIKGGTGNDTLDGGNGTDTLSFAGASAVTVSLAGGTATGDGADTFSNFENVTGSSNDDTIVGNSSANTIDGGNGNDTFSGGAGNDTLTGGSGTDTIDYSGAASGVTVSLITASVSNDGDGGSDTLSSIENVIGSGYADNITGDNNGNVIDGGAGNDTIEGRAGNDTLIGGLGTDTLSYDDASGGITVNLSISTAQNTVNAGTDTISGFENVVGNSSADIITGDSNANVLSGGGSGDILTGGGGSDTLYGEAGNDTLIGGAGNDAIDGGANTDTVDYSAAASGIVINLATGTVSNDGDGGSDTITGVENVTGTDYADTITGDSNNNILLGGNGDDLIEGGAATDTLTGGSGTDTLTYANATSGITINLAISSTQNTGGAGTDSVSGFENLTGSAYNDNLTGDSAANVITGGDGNDLVKGAGGNDTLYGGSGTNTLSYSAAAAGVTVSLASGTASNDGDGGTDTFSNFENITGSNYADTLTGDSTANTLSGGAGNDTLYGGSGNDTIGGGDDDDTLVGGDGDDTVTGDSGNDTFISGAGNDTFSGGSGAYNDTVDYSGAAAGITANFGTGIVSDGDGGTDTISNIYSIIGSAYADTITWRSISLAAIIDAGSGDDAITISSSHFSTGDAIVGGDGADSLALTSGAINTYDFTVGSLATLEILTGSGSGDNVTLFATSFAGMLTSINLAGAGTDVLNIVASGDISAATAATVTNTETGNLTGTSSNDSITLTGSQLNTIIIGSGTINLGSGSSDTINLTSTSSDLNTLGATDASILGVETISASTAGSGVTITLSGQTEAFTVTGSGSGDTITAGSGADTLYGGAGADSLYGGSGGDTLYGDANNDIVYGQNGLDTMTGGTGADTFVFESATAFNNIDVVNDFSTGDNDVLDISDILDGHYTYGVDTLTDFVEITDSGSDSIVKIDVTGTGTFGAGTQVATLLGITGLTNEASLETSGALVTF